MFSIRQQPVRTGRDGESGESPTWSESMASTQGRSSVPGRADILSVGLRGDVKAMSQETCMGYQQSDRQVVVLKPVKAGGAKGPGHQAYSSWPTLGTLEVQQRWQTVMGD